jgi:hypothetical protein
MQNTIIEHLLQIKLFPTMSINNNILKKIIGMIVIIDVFGKLKKSFTLLELLQLTQIEKQLLI